jgi:hypothetical protein
MRRRRGGVIARRVSQPGGIRRERSAAVTVGDDGVRYVKAIEGGSMRHAGWLVAALVIAVAAPLHAADIEVRCEPGLRIFVDGELAGVSTAEDDGLHVADIAEGVHLLRIEKEGFLSQTFTVDMRDTDLQVEVGAFHPLPPRGAEETPTPGAVDQDAGTGSLMILTAPQSCVVTIDGTPHTKDVPRLKLDDITAGDHAIAFSAPGQQQISGKVAVEKGQELTVRANLNLGEIKVVRNGKAEVVKERQADVAPWGRGSVRFYSEPRVCTINFSGKVIEKATPVVNRSFIPAGDYSVVASHGGREVSGTITIKRNQRAVVTISLADPLNPFTVTYEPE